MTKKQAGVPKTDLLPFWEGYKSGKETGRVLRFSEVMALDLGKLDNVHLFRRGERVGLAA